MFIDWIVASGAPSIAKVHVDSFWFDYEFKSSKTSEIDLHGLATAALFLSAIFVVAMLSFAISMTVPVMMYLS